jgi:hypothetical protein
MASNPVTWPTSLPFPSMSPSRTYRPRAEINRMESKRIRVRRYYPGFFTVFNFSWTFLEDEFEAFKTFFEVDLNNGQECFILAQLDPLDSDQYETVEYGLVEQGYSVTHQNGLYRVTAVAYIESSTVEVITEEFPVGLCVVVIWPDVSDGSGGGNPFECYDAGDYTVDAFTLAGTNITGIFKGDNAFGFQNAAEPFEGFPDGALFVATPSIGNNLLLMYYGDNAFGFNGLGLDYEDLTAGTYVPGTELAATGLLTTYAG